MSMALRHLFSRARGGPEMAATIAERDGDTLRGLGGASQTGDLPSTASPRDPHRSRGDATAGLSRNPLPPHQNGRYGALPPLVVARMSPASPATQPCVGLTKLKASRGSASASLGTSCLVQVAPPPVTGGTLASRQGQPPSLRTLRLGSVWLWLRDTQRVRDLEQLLARDVAPQVDAVAFAVELQSR